ncbi:MAG: hypothetical protein M3Z33_02950, partial [Actinomycetota bacterium]|nr:hypothetical protein [Actinomycetota bacterium]
MLIHSFFANFVVLPGNAKVAVARRRRAWLVMLALSAAISGTLTFGVSRGVAATSFTDYSTNFTRFESPDPQAAGRWSERIATVPDLNGDGKNELLIADLNESFGGFSRAGRVYMQ